jgi:hypothetical protein
MATMEDAHQDRVQARLSPEIEARIFEMRETGAGWKAIQEQFHLSRQQARYGYQRGKRTKRRAARRNPDQ